MSNSSPERTSSDPEALSAVVETPSVKTTYAAGDKAVYHRHGIVEVLSVEERNISSVNQKFYVLSVVGTDRRIVVPAANAESNGLRPLMSEVDVVQIFSVLRTHSAINDVTMMAGNGRIGRLREKIKSGDVFIAAEGLADLYILKKKRLTTSENKLFMNVRANIALEIALVRNQPVDQVLAEIDAIFA